VKAARIINVFVHSLKKFNNNFNLLILDTEATKRMNFSTYEHIAAAIFVSSAFRLSFRTSQAISSSFLLLGLPVPAVQRQSFAVG
jgi:hypothetical protein